MHIVLSAVSSYRCVSTCAAAAIHLRYSVSCELPVWTNFYCSSQVPGGAFPFLFRSPPAQRDKGELRRDSLFVAFLRCLSVTVAGQSMRTSHKGTITSADLAGY